jgi:protein SCO1
MKTNCSHPREGATPSATNPPVRDTPISRSVGRLTCILLCVVATLRETRAEDLPPCCRPALALGKPTDKSLYLLDSKWTSDVGKTIPLAKLRGRPQVVAMFFANCEYACPILVNDMKKLEAKLPAGVRAKTDFLLVSFDTQRDTPEALAAFRKKETLPFANWTLLRGGADDVRELAALLGINYVPDARGQFAHSNVITVLNAEGEITFQQPGLSADPAALAAAVTKAATDAKR